MVSVGVQTSDFSACEAVIDEEDEGAILESFCEADGVCSLWYDGLETCLTETECAVEDISSSDLTELIDLWEDSVEPGCESMYNGNHALTAGIAAVGAVVFFA